MGTSRQTPEARGHTITGTNSTTRTRGLIILLPYRDYVTCDTIDRYWYLSKRLTAVSAGRFYRFEHIDTDSSGKVVAKSDPSHGGGSHSPASDAYVHFGALTNVLETLKIFTPTRRYNIGIILALRCGETQKKTMPCVRMAAEQIHV